MAQESESRSLDKVIVRLPDGMRDELKALASEHKRSMNAEIVARLTEFHELDARLFDEILKNKKLEDELERLREFERTFSAVRNRFFHGKGNLKPLISVPADLYMRIEAAAARNHRDVDSEATAVLEEAYPAPEFSIEEFIKLHISKIMEAEGDEQEKLVRLAQEYLRANNSKMSVWLTETKTGEKAVAFGLQSIRDAGPEDLDAVHKLLVDTGLGGE